MRECQRVLKRRNDIMFYDFTTFEERIAFAKLYKFNEYLYRVFEQTIIKYADMSDLCLRDCRGMIVI